MADIAVPYVLNTPGTDITFNGGAVNDGTDLYYLTEITGLDGAPLRTPIDNAPQADGGLVHNFWKGPRHIVMEGAFLIQSTRIQTSIQTLRNAMEASLLSALEGILQADATLSWTPLGQAARVLTVRCDVPLNCTGVGLKTFSFGLVAAIPSW